MKFELSVLAFVATVANAQGAPDFDMACADTGLLYSTSEAADACWPQVNAMDAYCKDNKEDAACLEYEMALFGEDAFGEALVMRKSMLAAKKSLIKRTGAPTLDDKCMDMDFQYQWSPEADKCLDQFFAMDFYCTWENPKDAACTKYKETPFVGELVMRKSMLAAKKALLKRTGAPTYDEKCIDQGLLFDGSDEADKCWEQFDAMDAYCGDMENSEDATCTKYEEALFGGDLVMRKNMFAAKKALIKRTGAPTVNDKCFDLDVHDGSDEAEKCWKQYDAMNNFCQFEEYGRVDAQACSDYRENLIYGSAVAMQKRMTAFKAMRDQVSLMGKAETTSDSSSFSEVAVGAAVGMVVGAAGAIIAARSCTLKTDDAFSRV